MRRAYPQLSIAYIPWFTRHLRPERRHHEVRHVHRRAFLCCSAILALQTPCAFAFGATDWEALKRTIRSRYPEVRQIDTESLHAAFVRGDSPLLIDARTAAEYQVSHLQGAIRAETAAQAVTALAREPKDRAIVVYCSVGYRSSALARELMRLGHTQVANLEGSIFEWANKGFPVYRGTEPARVVHPYDASWGALLDRKLWSTERP
jgi:rhodanese-related sulfurtransferase